MSHWFVSRRVNVCLPSSIVLVALSLSACGSDQNGGTGTVGPGSSSGTTTSSDSAGTMGASSSGTTSSNNTSNGPTGTSTGGTSTGPSGTTGGSTSATTGPSGTSGASGSSSGSAASTSGASSPNAGTGGSDTDSGTTSGATTSSDETSGEPAECTREFLDGLLADYLAALSAGDASSLPLAADVKFTENAEELEIGTTDFWMNAGDTKHVQAALDTTQCSVAAQAVVPEGATDLPIGLRIKVEAAQIKEIETIVVRQGDYTASFAVPSEPADIITVAGQIGWHDEVPEAGRATREQLSGWVDKYFRAFPEGVCNVTSACRRLENGGGGNAGELGFSCGAGASCSANNSGANGFDPRVIIVDEVRGIAAGFTIFDAFGTSGHLDMHMMKMSGGEVHAVHAILRDTQGRSGWD